jgi:hypothetical protein
MFTIEIDMDRKCKRCGKGGATPGGLCMRCITRALKAGEFDHILKKAKEPKGKP